MGTFEDKNIGTRLVNNLKNLGDWGTEKKQSSLQFNIWKYCIQQRLMDETLFIVITCLIQYYFCFNLLSTTDYFVLSQTGLLGGHIFEETSRFVT